MVRLSQLGIAFGALGIVLTFMGLFPGVMGLRPAEGIGPVQIVIILSGFAMLILGALIFVKYAYYPEQPSTLAQQIGSRLALTGLVISALIGLSDSLGFGSHLRSEGEPYFGWLQAVGIVAGFLIASIGVMIFAYTGLLGVFLTAIFTKRGNTATVIGALLVGYWIGDLTWTVALFALTSACCYLVMLAWLFILALQDWKPLCGPLLRGVGWSGLLASPVLIASGFNVPVEFWLAGAGLALALIAGRYLALLKAAW